MGIFKDNRQRHYKVNYTDIFCFYEGGEEILHFVENRIFLETFNTVNKTPQKIDCEKMVALIIFVANN